MAIELNKVISIRGRKVVVMTDEVAAQTKFQDSLVLEVSNSLHEFIWVREDSLTELRKQHGSTPTYGLWQILLASRLIDLNKRLHLYEDGNERGSYLICDKGRAIESGRYIANQIPASAGAKYAEGHRLDVSVEQLVLPKITAKITSELVASKRRANIVTAIASITGIGLSVGIGLAVDQYLAAQAKARDKEIARISAESSRVQAEVDLIKTQVYEFDPSVRDSMLVAISRFAEITAQGPVTFTYVPGKEPENIIELQASSVPQGLSFPIEAGAQPGAKPKLKMSVDGMADSALNPMMLANNPATQTLLRATAQGKPAQ